MLGPVAGPLGRNALGGRNWEGFSPDPYLTGSLFGLTIEGVQSQGVQATAKHLVGNEQETQRNPTTVDDNVIMSVSSNIDDRTMHELYLWPFADGIKSGASAIMCSYNRLNGTYACENESLLKGLVKGELGYEGYIMSDWYAVIDNGPATLNGLDQIMPGYGEGFDTVLEAYVANGTVSESQLDDMVTRIMTPYFWLGQDEGFPSIDGDIAAIAGYDAEGTEFNIGDSFRDVRGNHSTITRELGAASAVLLKNVNNALPLKDPKWLAAFGNDAADITGGLAPPVTPFISWNYPIGTLMVGGGSGSVRNSYVVSPLEALKAHDKYMSLQYITSNDAILTPRTSDQPAVGSSATDLSGVYPVPEACLVFVNTYAGEGFDRTSYDVDFNGTAVIEDVAAICNNTIVITHSAGLNLLDFADNENVTAIIAAHLPGNEIGNSIVDILFGKVNPSAKIPYTIAYSASDYNTEILNITNTNETASDAWSVDFTEGLFIDYRHFDAADIEPRYEFGFGLSYTTFNISDVAVSVCDSEITARPANATVVPGGNPNLYSVLATVTATVTNTGGNSAIDGATVAQLYISYANDTSIDTTTTPVKVLRGFEKTETLEVGASQTVSFDVTRKDLSYWDVVAQDWVLPSGGIEFKVGLSSRDIQGAATATLLA